MVSSSAEFGQQVDRWGRWFLQRPTQRQAAKSGTHASESLLVGTTSAVVSAIQPKDVAGWCALVLAVPNLFYLQVSPDNDPTYVTAHEALTEALWVFVFEGLQERWQTLIHA
jgi:hypothetical protein